MYQNGQWVLINWPKIPQIPPNLSAQINCQSPKFLDYDEKNASLGVHSRCRGLCAVCGAVPFNKNVVEKLGFLHWLSIKECNFLFVKPRSPSQKLCFICYNNDYILALIELLHESFTIMKYGFVCCILMSQFLDPMDLLVLLATYAC